MILLDTHVFWRVAREEPLGRRARRMIDTAMQRGELRVSAITWWELQMLIIDGRLERLQELSDLRRAALSSGFSEIPVDGEIGIVAAKLTGMHRDPADRILVATALATGATLLTGDARILEIDHGPKLADASE